MLETMTLCQQMIPAACQSHFSSRFYHGKLSGMHCREIRFYHVLWVEKCFHHSTLYFVFFTNKRAVISSAPTDQSQFSFPAGFRHEFEHALFDASFWHQKNLALEKYDRLTSFCLKLASVSSLLDYIHLKGETLSSTVYIIPIASIHMTNDPTSVGPVFHAHLMADQTDLRSTLGLDWKSSQWSLFHHQLVMNRPSNLPSSWWPNIDRSSQMIDD